MMGRCRVGGIHTSESGETHACFSVPDMSCGHCVNAITRAIADADPAATVAADLEHRRITVTGGSLDAEALRAIIADAGYTATAT